MYFLKRYYEVNDQPLFTAPVEETDTSHSDSTGRVFTGKVVRRFEGKRVNFKEDIHKQTCEKLNDSCENWGVMTTIFPPSEAVRRFIYLKQWCLVVVGDLKTTTEYQIATSRLIRNQVVYLSPEQQVKFLPEFSKKLQWNSFGRKNVGYLYALSRGAKRIWDFDDDNFLKFWVEGAAADPNLDLNNHLLNSEVGNVSVNLMTCPETTFFVNPYPQLGATVPNAWPRGFPISEVASDESVNCFLTPATKDVGKIGILQSLADHQPDVDAVFRMTVKDKFYFDSSKVKLQSNSSRYMLLRNRVYAPTNAQASLYFKDAFPTLYLPVTVPGRVSDIWRSYIGQAVLSLYGIHTGFFWRPLVDQNRNDHSFEADFQSEIDLYTKTKAFLTVLDSWVNQNNQRVLQSGITMQTLITDLYVNLYERQFIEFDDVENIQLWLHLLSKLCSRSNKSKESFKYSQQPEDFDISSGAPIISGNVGQDTYKCKSDLRSRTFWTSDLQVHEGSAIDIHVIRTLASLGNKIIIAGFNGKQTLFPETLNNANIKAYTIPPTKAFQSYKTNLTVISKDMIENNVHFFESNDEFDKVDVIVCSFPALCQLWFPFNKTKSIFFLPAQIYNFDSCTLESWNLLNKKLEELTFLNNYRDVLGHVIGAVSRYNLEYLKHYTGLNNVNLIPSFTEFDTDAFEYRPQKTEILVISLSVPAFLKKVKRLKMVYYRTKHMRYTLNDIRSHPAIIFIPFVDMNYTFTEFYSLNIPMFVPSAAFFLQNGGLKRDRTSKSRPYCTKDRLSWRKMPKHPNSYHSYNPNTEFAESQEDEMYWLQFRDFYEFPHVIYFDNTSHLEYNLKNTDLNSVHNFMKNENNIRRNSVVKSWCNILTR